MSEKCYIYFVNYLKPSLFIVKKIIFPCHFKFYLQFNFFITLFIVYDISVSIIIS